MEFDTSNHAIALALHTLDHARTIVSDLQPDDVIFLSDGTERDSRCINDSGFSLHVVVECRAVTRSDERDKKLWLVKTDRTEFLSSGRFTVYKVGAQRS